MSFKIVDDRKPNEEEPKKQRKYGRTRRIPNYSKYRQVRQEKIEEIMAVWNLPGFRTNNARLVCLFRYCQSPENGYTIREFAQARFPDKMSSGYVGEAFRALHQMFRRFRRDVTSHEIILNARFVKSEIEGIWRWYYYNMVDDEEALKDVRLRAERCALGLDKAIQDNEGLLKISYEDWTIMNNRYIEELKRKQRHTNKKGGRRAQARPE